jgi:hypothetical protein
MLASAISKELRRIFSIQRMDNVCVYPLNYKATFHNLSKIWRQVHYLFVKHKLLCCLSSGQPADDRTKVLVLEALKDIQFNLSLIFSDNPSLIVLFSNPSFLARSRTINCASRHPLVKAKDDQHPNYNDGRQRRGRTRPHHRILFLG